MKLEITVSKTRRGDKDYLQIMSDNQVSVNIVLIADEIARDDIYKKKTTTILSSALNLTNGFQQNTIQFVVSTRNKITIIGNPLFIIIIIIIISLIIEGKRRNARAKTGYNIIDRAFGFYPHFFRLSRITNFFLEGWTIAQVHSWTGLTLKALDFYLGLVEIDRMGMSLSRNRSNH